MLAPDLVDHVAVTSGLSRTEAARVVGDVLAYYGESTEEYVRRRHRELRTVGTRNAAIWRQLSGELDSRVVAAPRLTERQLRRIVYG